METGAVSVAAPEADDSRVVAERQPRKSLTPASRLKDAIFGLSPMLSRVTGRYFPTLFRRGYAAERRRDPAPNDTAR